ncbi:type VI secretion system baseplate subunit TssK [Tautonia rosea]|uniref:type VI secretion system baseplate subunit TssK n=1 Tax=Tautonia rosea TaxID=2728037 RepID=UPI001472A4AE|nr:type VI secretion system baseplate subunit TssK [Tautonia rosea]
MSKRAVHWYEGMFLKPHHFQAADRFHRDRLRESEDWLHPHNWGLRSLEIDPDAIANFTFILRSCQARFRDGTTLNVPGEATVDPLDLRPILSAHPEATISLAVPTWQPGRANVALSSSADGPRYVIDAVDQPDENTGGDEEGIEFRRVQARLLASHVDPTGYETLPLARVSRSASADAPPRIVRSYTPPILGLDGWEPLNDEVQSVFQMLRAWIDQEASYLVGRKITFESQVIGESDRILKLSAVNGAFSAMQSVLFTRGLHPIHVYIELCRLLGHLSIFDDARRPIDVPNYDHDDIGPIYARVIAEIRRLIGGGRGPEWTKRYFQLEGRRFQVHLDADWLRETTKLYIGVETVELNDAECDELMRGTNWKLGAGEQVGEIFRQGQSGLGLQPLNRIPPALPRNVVYFEVQKKEPYWRDVLRTRTLGLRFNLEGGSFLGDSEAKQLVALPRPRIGSLVELQFAVYVIPHA